VPHHREAGSPSPDAAAGDVLHRLLVEQRAELGRREDGIRRGVPDSVHKARVATRRLRSALSAYRPLLDRDVADPVRRELRWLARTLGDSRDLEVVHERLCGLLDGEPPFLVVGPVRRRLDATYAGRQQEADAHVQQALDSRRHQELLAALDRLVTAPPWTAAAEARARDVLLPRVRGEWKALDRRVRAIPGAVDRDRAVHDARKAAKSLRYVVEALVPAWGADAERLAGAAKEISSLLGERQDTVVARRDLAALAREASEAGESSFTYGRLHAREEANAARLDRDFEKLWAVSSGRRLRAWLRSPGGGR
jgi:CHAD domain-containing protein